MLGELGRIYLAHRSDNGDMPVRVGLGELANQLVIEPLIDHAEVAKHECPFTELDILWHLGLRVARPAEVFHVHAAAVKMTVAVKPRLRLAHSPSSSKDHVRSGEEFPFA